MPASFRNTLHWNSNNEHQKKQRDTLLPVAFNLTKNFNVHEAKKHALQK
jgi:hypothetical protein